MGYSRASYGEAAGSAGWCLHAPYYMLAGENISARFVVPTVAASVDLVVHLGLDHGGVRRVNEIVAVPGRVENDIIEDRDDLRASRRGAAQDERDPATPRALRTGRYRRARSPGRECLMGAILGLGVGIGLMLI
jgi:hypothetical protein